VGNSDGAIVLLAMCPSLVIRISEDSESVLALREIGGPGWSMEADRLYSWELFQSTFNAPTPLVAIQSSR
jgi:hypothetical protein